LPVASLNAAGCNSAENEPRKRDTYGRLPEYP
jgi:hypothetical protein